MKLCCVTRHKRIQTHNKGLFYVSAAGSEENNRIKCAQVGDGDPPAWTGCCCRGKGTCSLQASLIQCKQRAFWGFSAAFLAYSVRPVMQIADGRPPPPTRPPPERTAVPCGPLQCAENDGEANEPLCTGAPCGGHSSAFPEKNLRDVGGRGWEGRGGVRRSRWFQTRLTCCGDVCSIGWPAVEARVGPVGAQYRIDDESTQQRVQQPVDATHGGRTGWI